VSACSNIYSVYVVYILYPSRSLVCLNCCQDYIMNFVHTVYMYDGRCAQVCIYNIDVQYKTMNVKCIIYVYTGSSINICTLKDSHVYLPGDKTVRLTSRSAMWPHRAERPGVRMTPFKKSLMASNWKDQVRGWPRWKVFYGLRGRRLGERMTSFKSLSWPQRRGKLRWWSRMKFFRDLRVGGQNIGRPF
jgi:hypothetical protein